ncbi:UDP-glucose 4-epimerase [Histoplasma mississippiense (nom. inval.)]|uniref:UDP-glucose 4-epimerase n=1 Tax=Ajellomyces capsulatus (strain NAm1 / WU24) TaxID=2059318 RepID=UPI000157B57A|nr:UDP-glucose 4-epimerase [Histoplasma mississippiense (nom. inval.)]EDN03091.1 UDP-glucose 4-epimerase [Histoplasma mississippiense (nom. inval.)]
MNLPWLFVPIAYPGVVKPSGTGYIGSFTALALLEAGYKVVIADNLYNSSDEAINRIGLICGRRPGFVKIDITNEADLDRAFEQYPDIDSVIHFAALKAVGESGEKPLDYYYVNVYGSICLLRAMKRHNVTNIVFSSSATVATGKREKLLVYGDDYASHDGTAIRDYIHILDLAAGHLQALNYLRENHPGVRAWNLGTGKGSTVFHMIKAFSAAVGRDLPYEVVGRRAGDVLDLTGNPSRANRELGWKATRTLEEACEDLWRWTKNNPAGYRQQPPQDLLDKLKEGK